MTIEKETQTPADTVAEQSGDFVKANPELNPRTQQMAEIAARSNADRERESQETMPATNEDGEASAPEQTLEQAGAEASAAAEAAENDEDIATPGSQPAAPAATAPAPAQSAIDPTADYEITVEGQKVKVKGAKIVERGFAALQKESAADYKLQLASQALAEAERIRASAQPAQPARAALPVQGAPAAELGDAALAELIQFGNPQQAAEAVKTLRARDASSVTAEGMQQFMARALPQAVDAQIAFREAATFAKSEYGDLLTDPYLKELFFIKEDQFRKAGDKRPYKDLYKAIGDDIRTHFNRPAAAPTQQAPSMQERKDAKARAPAAPKLAAARLEGGASAKQPKSREEIIEGMRQSRGQTSLNRI